MTVEQGMSAGDDFEPWELEDEKVCPAEIVEEVLIMAMPLSAMHENAAACRVYEPAEEEVQQTTRPFATLKAQLDQDK